MNDSTPAPESKPDLDLNDALAELKADQGKQLRIENPHPVLSASQKNAVAHLASLFRLRLLAPSIGGVRVRTNVLLAGPSGAGKTTAVQLFASQAGIPLLSLSVGAWTIWNARNEAYTLHQVHNFVRCNRAGILFIDELDKMKRVHSEEQFWTSSLVMEIYSLLDADERLVAANFSAEDRQRLGRNFFFVGAGAWHQKWTEAFAQKGNTEAIYLEAVSRASGLPGELFNRFADPLVGIMPPAEEELVEFLARIHSKIDLVPPSKEGLRKLATAAIESGQSMRFLENYATRILIGATSHLPLANLLAAVPAVKTTDLNLALGESKTEAQKRLFTELRTSAIGLENATNKIFQLLIRTDPKSWIALYRALALDASAAASSMDHFGFPQLELLELPTTIRLEERLVAIAKHKPNLLAELSKVFEKVSNAAIDYTTIGKTSSRKANEKLMHGFGKWSVAQIRELLNSTACCEIPRELKLLLQEFTREFTKWERTYFELLSLLS